MRQLTRIDQVKEVASSDPNIRAAFMYGSFIKGEGDKFSDIEFYLFLEDNKSFDESSWIKKLGNPLVYFQNEFGTKVAVYDDLIRAEFHFLNIDEIEVIKSWEGLVSFENRDKMIHVDKDGRLKQVLDSIEVLSPVRNSEESVTWLAQSLINSLIHTFSLVNRREWAHAHMSFAFIQKYIVWLLRIDENSFKHWEGPTKSLEKELTSKAYEKYEKVCPALGEGEIVDSFKAAIVIADELFRTLKVDESISLILKKISLHARNDVLS